MTVGLPHLACIGGSPQRKVYVFCGLAHTPVSFTRLSTLPGSFRATFPTRFFTNHSNNTNKAIVLLRRARRDG
jgi:hypothetical protein